MIKNTLTAAALLLGSVPAVAQNVDPKVHAMCQEAKDYAGCVSAMTTSPERNPNDPLVRLRSSMKQVSSRLAVGTSLNDATMTFQPVVDAHAVVPADQQQDLSYRTASLAIRLFDITKQTWQARINGKTYGGRYVGWYYSRPTCRVFKGYNDYFNAVAGKKAARWSWNKSGLIGCAFGRNPENSQYTFVAGLLRDGSISPSEIAEYTANRDAQLARAKLSVWERHLADTPGLAVWAKANPTLALAKRREVEAKSGPLVVDLPALPARLSYLRCSHVDLTGRTSRDCKPFSIDGNVADNPFKADDTSTDPSTYIPK